MLAFCSNIRIANMRIELTRKPSGFDQKDDIN